MVHNIGKICVFGDAPVAIRATDPPAETTFCAQAEPGEQLAGCSARGKWFFRWSRWAAPIKLSDTTEINEQRKQFTFKELK